MSTITKEQLRERAREKVKSLEFSITQTAFADSRAELEEELELARIALASLEADAVAYVDPFAFHNFSVYRAGETDNKRMGREWMWANPDAGLIPVYTAPPSPLAPDLKELEEILDWILMLPCPTPKATHFAKRLAVVIDTCRAAMLQGAENAESTTTIQTAPDLDSLPKIAESPSGNSPVIPDGWKLVPVEPTMSQELAGYRTLTDTGKMSRLMKTRLSNIYRAMIAAAPQQEVNNG